MDWQAFAHPETITFLRKLMKNLKNVPQRRIHVVVRDQLAGVRLEHSALR